MPVTSHADPSNPLDISPATHPLRLANSTSTPKDASHADPSYYLDVMYPLRLLHSLRPLNRRHLLPHPNATPEDATGTFHPPRTLRRHTRSVTAGRRPETIRVVCDIPAVVQLALDA